MYLQWFSVGVDIKSSFNNQGDRFQSKGMFAEKFLAH